MVGAQFPPGRGDTAPLPRIPAEPSPPRRAPVLKIAGLVAVAVVAGLVWWLVRGGSAEEAPPAAQAPAKEFQFTVTEGPVAATDCAANSYSQVKQFFAEHPCQRLSRALYTTASGASRALVSVAVVTMATPEEAQQLKKLADTDGTGNVNDLVRDGTAKIPGAPKLAGGDYLSRVTGSSVTIVLSAFFDGHSDEATLQRISKEALDLAPGA
ncbi:MULTISPECIES: hypothetical protein [Amycolatopsis]|uniref:Uncharacterized protein n=1 Tax=Amycolatopsis thermalba TaxID=944492 RepID=A0ABY4NVH4_9PSEU|nr:MULTISPECIES: hypothetical protein [Amycolatopsis]OXM71941.1 hypothetical protein CF166_17740 [Amycolatopsis sp. KNN50.9b]UQS24030.1 hypothetical protein L1857_14930 [Amycolatopsis thermalba]